MKPWFTLLLLRRSLLLENEAVIYATLFKTYFTVVFFPSKHTINANITLFLTTKKLHIYQKQCP